MLKQAFLINTDLKMDKGKIAVQVAHCVIQYMVELNKRPKDDPMNERYKEWKSETPDDPIGMMKKVVLKSTKDNIVYFSNRLNSTGIWTYKIFDKGFTQVEPNSLTCLIVEPLDEETYDRLFSSMKLL